MKKLLLGSAAFLLLSAGVASATDMPIKAPVYKAVEPLYDWSGLYVGVYSGVGVQRSRGFDPSGIDAGVVERTGAGVTGGGTLGYNRQFNRNWVVGVEADFGYLGLNHNIPAYNDPLDNSKTSWIGTLRGRAGYSNGPTLNYITAGGAWVHADDSVGANGGVSPAATNSKTLGGFTIGTGVETMLGGNWTAKAETLYVDVGSGNALRSGLVSLLQTDKNRYQVMKFGINYLFGGKQPALMAHNWNGFYAGIVGGTAVTESRGTDPTGTIIGQIGNNDNGLTIGGMAGYNLQFAPSWVAGVEGDFSYLGINHSNTNYNTPAAVLGLKTSWLGTLRGRVGYSTGPALLYVTAGGAWVHLQDQWSFATPTSSTTTKSGGAFGGGIETILSGNWTSKTEYLFIDAGRGNTLVSDGNSMQVDHTFHVFRSALIYQFGSQ